MASPNGEDSDGLEIISIGTLYKGSLEKKYWSSSRGKDRYPYPIGYQAVRTHIGIVYSMEIREGLKGPSFAISSNDGESSTGQTPDIAWESFQKKGGPRVKSGLGKRFSCRIGGVELFGFRNPLVQRLLRELITNVSGKAQQSILSSNFSNGDGRVEPETRSPDSILYPDLSPSLGNPENMRKRTRKHNLKTLNSASGASLKRLQTQVSFDNAEISFTTGGNGSSHNERRCLSSSTLKENCRVNKDTGASPLSIDRLTLVDKGTDPIPIKDCSLHQSPEDYHGQKLVLSQEIRFLNLQNSSFSCSPSNPSNEEKNLHRLPSAENKVCNSLLETEDNYGENINLPDSNTASGFDLCVPDTLEVLHEVVADSDEEFYKEKSCNYKNELVEANKVGCEELMMDMHSEQHSEPSLSYASFEKSEQDSVGQEAANSMMTLLLPQVLPLLKKTRRNKQPAPHNSGISLFIKDPSLEFSAVKTAGENEAGIPIEGHNVHHEQVMSFGPVRDSEFVSQDVNRVVPDSEDGQFGDHDIDHRPLCCDLVADRNTAFEQKEYNLDTWKSVVCGGEDQEFSNLNAETGRKVEVLLGEVSDAQNKMVGNDNFVPDSPLSCISPDRQILLDTEPPINAPLNTNGNSLCPQIQSGVGSFTKEELRLDCNKDTPLEPTFSPQSRLLSSTGEAMPKSVADNGPVNSSTRFHGKETASSSQLVASCSKASNLELPFLSSSVMKSIKSLTSDPPEPQLVQYQRKRCSAAMKLQNTDNPEGHPDYISHKNQESIDCLQPSSTRCIEDDRIKGVESSFVSEKGVGSETDRAFMEMPDLAHSTRNHSGPISESICRNTREDCVPEAYAATLSETGVVETSGSFCNRLVTVGSETKTGEHHQGLNAEKGMARPKGTFICMSSSSSLSEAVAVQEKSENVETHHLDSVTEMENRFSLDIEPNEDSKNIVELLGSYLHPSPVLSMQLISQGDDIHICVLCGLLQDRNRVLFIYKVPIKEAKGGCPSFLGYTSFILPGSGTTFVRENAFERSGWQFTPDGQYLVLPNSIKAASCRNQSALCSCSVCKSDCLEENALKIVHVKLGYVAPVAKLKTGESVCCILVCEPNHLVAAEENGGLHVWAMNSRWSASENEFDLPGLGYISPSLVELKRVPKCDSLLVGQDGFGNFGLWDISKRILLSKYSYTGSSVIQVLPIGFFRIPSFSGADVEEHIKGLMAATKACVSSSCEDPAFFSPNDEGMAVWVLIYAAGDSEIQYQHRSSGIKPRPTGCWRLALLVKNTLILGSALDSRASAVDASAGYGVIGTTDGLVHIWELTTGMKLVDLPNNIKGGSVSCIASDKSGVVAIANEQGYLLVYATLSKGFENLVRR
ncbi:hypothetical protein C5167_022772 [Papaver somniferum]|uniref:FYR C-terminal domain-containing protein n=1 Tax=Papaver somniferum TaxID=3469 RepID=A0A4Y7JKD4_PAPSO|nr:uncharacterized protein LOC113279152 [Papaver somniferum]RZC61016.1 hypothetical protein C5167_022772 [Papaver somniferum]